MVRYDFYKNQISSQINYLLLAGFFISESQYFTMIMSSLARYFTGENFPLDVFFHFFPSLDL